MAKLKLRVKGLDEFVRQLQRAPELVIDVADEVIQRIGVQLQREARDEAPKDTGQLRSQILYDKIAPAQAQVIAKSEYAHDVHEGRRPSKIVDTKPLERWAERHGIDNSYLLIKHIERFGTDKNPFMDRAFQIAEKFIEAHLRTGADLMAERLAK